MPKKTYGEMAAEAEAVKDTDAELERLVPVKARVAKNLKMVRSVRMSAPEYSEVTKAAQAKGMETGEFIRLAALAAAQGELRLDLAQIRTEWGATLGAISSFTERLYGERMGRSEFYEARKEPS